jgi:hypothetical protein
VTRRRGEERLETGDGRLETRRKGEEEKGRRGEEEKGSQRSKIQDQRSKTKKRLPFQTALFPFV